MITHAAFPKTLLYCFIGPPLRGGLFYGGASRTRTYDPIDVNDVLYRLSHGTMSFNDM